MTHALVRHDVARDPAGDPHGLQPLAVLAAVDLDARGPRRRRAGRSTSAAAWIGVVAQPRPGGVRAAAGGADLDPQRALAAGLDQAVGRLAEHGEVGGEPVGQLALDAAEPVARGLDLLAVVEHERQVVRGARRRWRRGAGTPRRPPSCRWCRSRRGGRPSRRLGRLSAIGTVSRCPASSTRRSRPRCGAGEDGVAVADAPRGGAARAARPPRRRRARRSSPETLGTSTSAAVSATGSAARSRARRGPAHRPTLPRGSGRPDTVDAREHHCAVGPAAGTGLATVAPTGPSSTPGTPRPSSAATPPDVRRAGEAGGRRTPTAGCARAVVRTADRRRWPPPPADAADVYLRLHLLSHRLVRPHEVNLDGVFGLLANVVWTNHGPCAVAGFETVRARLRARGPVTVYGVDKFPRMVDYVRAVRRADRRRGPRAARRAPGRRAPP